MIPTDWSDICVAWVDNMCLIMFEIHHKWLRCENLKLQVWNEVTSKEERGMKRGLSAKRRASFTRSHSTWYSIYSNRSTFLLLRYRSCSAKSKYYCLLDKWKSWSKGIWGKVFSSARPIILFGLWEKVDVIVCKTGYAELPPPINLLHLYGILDGEAG